MQRRIIIAQNTQLEIELNNYIRKHLVKSDDDDDCWRWSGPRTVKVGEYYLKPHVFLLWFFRRNVAKTGTITRKCSDFECVNPSHFAHQINLARKNNQGITRIKVQSLRSLSRK